MKQKDTRTRAAQNRKIRQEALRDQLEAQGHVQHVAEIAEKLGDDMLEPKDVTRLKAKADIHLALIKKYIPDLKAVELTGDPEKPIGMEHQVPVATVDFLKTIIKGT